MNQHKYLSFVARSVSTVKDSIVSLLAVNYRTRNLGIIITGYKAWLIASVRSQYNELVICHSAVAKIKSVTNNLPIFSVSAFRIVLFFDTTNT